MKVPQKYYKKYYGKYAENAVIVSVIEMCAFWRILMVTGSSIFFRTAGIAARRAGQGKIFRAIGFLNLYCQVIEHI